MSSLYLSRLSAEERSALTKSLHNAQSGCCFICMKPIDLVLHSNTIDIDHIEPLATGGKDSPGNFGLTHASCNRSKQASDLRVARVLARFKEIADGVEGRSPNLTDILKEYGGAQHNLPAVLEGTALRVSFPDIGENQVLTVPIHEDSLSGFKSVFLDLPVQYVHHDDHINPRPIGKNITKLVTEFYRRLPQLHVALGWINCSANESSQVLLFDGQHKAAAQILLGVHRIPVRIFINPNLDVLLTANTRAGTILKQVAFDMSVQRSLGSALLKDRIKRYQIDHGMSEDDESFSEQSLVSYLKSESREVKRYILDSVRSSITNHSDNRLGGYIEQGGRSTDRPLSYSTIEKTFYSFFIGSDLLPTPFNYKLEEGANPRQLEIEQTVRLMNIIADRIFIGSFDTSIGTSQIENKIAKGIDIPEPHLRAFRMAREEIIYSWLQNIPRIIQYYFFTNGLSFNEARLLQYQIPETCWGNIERFITALSRLSMWTNKSTAVFSGKRNSDYWQSVFATGKTPEEPPVEVMSKGIDIMTMIQPEYDT